MTHKSHSSYQRFVVQIMYASVPSSWCRREKKLFLFSNNDLIALKWVCFIFYLNIKYALYYIKACINIYIDGLKIVQDPPSNDMLLRLCGKGILFTTFTTLWMQKMCVFCVKVSHVICLNLFLCWLIIRD